MNKKGIVVLLIVLILGSMPNFAEASEIPVQKIVLEDFDSTLNHMLENNNDLKIKELELEKTKENDKEAQRKIRNLEKDLDLIMKYGGRDGRVQAKVQTEVNNAKSTFGVEMQELALEVTKKKLTQSLTEMLNKREELTMTINYMETSQKNLKEQVRQAKLQMDLGNIIKTDYDSVVISQKELENNINRTYDALNELNRNISILVDGHYNTVETKAKGQFEVSKKRYDREVANKRMLENQKYLYSKQKELEFLEKEYKIYRSNYTSASLDFVLKEFDYKIAVENHQKTIDSIMNEFNQRYDEIIRLRYDVQIAKDKLDLAKAKEIQEKAKFDANLITQIKLIDSQNNSLNSQIDYIKAVSTFNKAVNDFEFFLDYGKF